jgi:putative MATE family efflux protein
MGGALTSLAVAHSHLPDAKQCLVLRALARKVGTPFDEELHTPLLRRLWAALEPAGANAPFERRSEAWTRCGFQQSDPATDVRGGGELALECLVHFAERHPVAVRRILAANERRERVRQYGSYPFACAGLNLVCTMCEIFRVKGHMVGAQGKFAVTRAPFWGALDGDRRGAGARDGVGAFCELFVTAFGMLDEAWETGECTYMEFPKVLAGTRAALLQHLHQEHCPPLLPPLEWRAALGRSPHDRDIFALALPSLLTLTIGPIAGMVETATIGRVGTESLGAIGLSNTIFALSFKAFNFLSYATTPLVARLQREREAATVSSQTVARALWLALGIGIAMTAAVILSSWRVLLFMNAEPGLASVSHGYNTIRAWSAVPAMTTMVCTGAFRGFADTRTPITLTVTAAVLQVSLGALLAFGFGGGLRAYAVAQLVTAWTEAAGLLWLLVRAGRLQLCHAWPPPRPQLVVKYFQAGGWLLLRTIALQLTMACVASIAAKCGTVSLAAYTVVQQVASLGSLIVDAVAVAAQALIARYVSVKDYTTAAHAARRMQWIAFAIGVVYACLLQCPPVLWLPAPAHWFAALFTTDSKVVQEVMRAAPLVALTQLPAAQAYVFDGILMGAGEFWFLAVAMCTIGGACLGAARVFVPASASAQGQLDVLAPCGVVFALMVARTALLWARWTHLTARSRTTAAVKKAA